MLARQLLADPNRRQGYGLNGGLIGLTFNACMALLALYAWCWFRR